MKGSVGGKQKSLRHSPKSTNQNDSKRKLSFKSKRLFILDMITKYNFLLIRCESSSKSAFRAVAVFMATINQALPKALHVIEILMKSKSLESEHCRFLSPRISMFTIRRNVK